MDEILIGEKKYVSSKQAAKATGYAKDYIGQLCREGRVPARLVGRSWYVLESAIHDHRFGNPENQPVEEQKPASQDHPTWEAPRYEASEVDVLPSVNRLRDAEPQAPEPLQDAWQAWFDRFNTISAPAPTAPAGEPAVVEESIPEEPVEERPEEIDEEIAEEQDQGVEIPIRTVYKPQQQPSPEELLPRGVSARAIPLAREERKVQRRGALRTLQLAGIIIAILSASTAALGSGYFDPYIISNSQVRMIAGVSLYNK